MLTSRAAWLFVCGAVVATSTYLTVHSSAAPLSQAEAAATESVRPVIDRYCITSDLSPG